MQRNSHLVVEFMHGHGQFSTETYNEIKSECSEYELYHGVTSKKCQAALDKMDEEKGYKQPSHGRQSEGSF